METLLIYCCDNACCYVIVVNCRKSQLAQYIAAQDFLYNVKTVAVGFSLLVFVTTLDWFKHTLLVLCAYNYLQHKNLNVQYNCIVSVTGLIIKAKIILIFLYCFSWSYDVNSQS